MKPRTYKRMCMDRQNLDVLLTTPKDSSSIHYDDGQCSDPIRCDCCCPACWEAKAVVIRRGVWATKRLVADAARGKVGTKR